jgi:hypothetical protein
VSICSNGLFNIWSDYESAHLFFPGVLVKDPLQRRPAQLRLSWRWRYLRRSACSLPGSPDMRRFLSTVSTLKFGDVLTPVKLVREEF